jgi:hypothetical protein
MREGTVIFEEFLCDGCEFHHALGRCGITRAVPAAVRVERGVGAIGSEVARGRAIAQDQGMGRGDNGDRSVRVVANIQLARLLGRWSLDAPAPRRLIHGVETEIIGGRGGGMSGTIPGRSFFSCWRKPPIVPLLGQGDLSL